MSARFKSTGQDVYHPEWVAHEQRSAAPRELPATLEGKRLFFNQTGQQLAKQWPVPEEPITITDEIITPENLTVRVYKPQTDRNDLPLLIYFHGGGFISGDLDTEFPHCRYMAVKTPCIVIDLAYPLAPAVQMDDIIRCGLRTVEWAKSHNPPLTTSPILLLGGGSAGGTLALQLTYHFLHHGTTAINGLILVEPTCSPAAAVPYKGPHHEMHTSAKDKAEGAPLLDRSAQLTMIHTPKMDVTNPAHFPLLGQSLHGFPRTYVIVAEHDPTRDDGIILAQRIAEESGVETLEVCCAGMPHWFQWFPDIPMAHVMLARTVRGIKFVLEEMSREEAERWD